MCNICLKGPYEVRVEGTRCEWSAEETRANGRGRRNSKLEMATALSGLDGLVALPLPLPSLRLPPPKVISTLCCLRRRPPSLPPSRWHVISLQIS